MLAVFYNFCDVVVIKLTSTPCLTTKLLNRLLKQAITYFNKNLTAL